MLHLEFKKYPVSYCELFLLLLASMLNVDFKKCSCQNVRFEGQEPRLEISAESSVLSLEKSCYIAL